MNNETVTQEREPTRTINGVGIVPVVPRDLAEANSLATTLAKSALLPAALRNKAGDVLVMILAGLEMGMGPMQSIRGFHVIEGKPVMSADLMMGLVKRSPCCQYFQLIESTGEIATYATQRIGESETRMSFTIEEARTAGVANKDNWKKYPAAMLRARTASALARAVYPDIILGVYTPEEVGSMEVIDATPPNQLGSRQVDQQTGEVLEGEVVNNEAQANGNDEAAKKKDAHKRFFVILSQLGLKYQTETQKQTVRDALSVVLTTKVYSMTNLTLSQLEGACAWLMDVKDGKKNMPTTWQALRDEIAAEKPKETTDETLEADLQASIDPPEGPSDAQITESEAAR